MPRNPMGIPRRRRPPSLSCFACCPPHTLHTSRRPFTHWQWRIFYTGNSCLHKTKDDSVWMNEIYVYRRSDTHLRDFGCRFVVYQGINREPWVSIQINDVSFIYTPPNPQARSKDAQPLPRREYSGCSGAIGRRIVNIHTP